VKSIIQAIPRWILAAIRTKTGATIAAGIVIYGLKAVGIDIAVPLESVIEALRGIGIDGLTPDSIILGALGLYGTIYANETANDMRRKLAPRRRYLDDMMPFSLRYRAVVADDGLATRIKVAAYEAEQGHLIAIGENGMRVEVLLDAMTDDELALYNELMRTG
jgi:hypothetical protein